MDVTTHIEALVAAFELYEVRLLREAMRIVVPVERVEARAREAAAIYEQRCEANCCQETCCNGEPYANPRIVTRSQPAAAAGSGHAAVGAGSAAPQTEAPGESCGAPSPIQPPWKVLPWNTPVRPVVQLKRIIVRPDIIMSNRGAMLDLFI